MERQYVQAAINPSPEQQIELMILKNIRLFDLIKHLQFL